MQQIKGWLKHRFGDGPIVNEAAANLRKPVPRFVNGWYALGTVLMAYLALQFLTGLLLSLYYVPSSQGAAASISVITDRVSLGWLVRSLHHWGATFIVIVALLHMGKSLWTGSYKAPRELTWVAGVLLLAVLLGFGLTGYLLPWDQLAYWGTTVVSDSFGALPVVGPFLLKVLRGGSTVGDATLLRFYVIHILVLPGTLVLLAGGHLLLIRRFGTAPAGRGTREAVVPPADLDPKRPFWPIQVLHELPVVYLLLGIMVTVALLDPPGVGVPADPFSTPSGIKPEWYFLPNYQLFKYIPTWLGLIVTGLGGLLVLLLPWWDTGPLRWLPERPAARWVTFGAVAFLVLLGVLGGLSENTIRLGRSELRFDIRSVPSLHPVDPATAAMLDLRSVSSDTLRERSADLLDLRCAGCHGGPSPLMGLGLEPGSLEENTVGVASRESGTPIIAAGDPDGSYLIMKVEGSEGARGSRMPAAGAYLDPDEIALLKAWISRLPTGSGAAVSGNSRTGALIVIWAVLLFGMYSAWMKRKQLETEGH